jgi:hypothetical protein
VYWRLYIIRAVLGISSHYFAATNYSVFPPSRLPVLCLGQKLGLYSMLNTFHAPTCSSSYFPSREVEIKCYIVLQSVVHSNHNQLTLSDPMIFLFPTLLLIFNLSNPIFLPLAYSPSLIYFGREWGWWVTCNYPTVLKEKNRNRKSTNCAICWPKPVLHEEKRREQENYDFPVPDAWKGLMPFKI